MSLFCEGIEDDKVETELLFTSEKVFPPCVLLDEEVPEKFWLVLVIWAVGVELLVLEAGFVLMLLVEIEGVFPPLNRSCESCGTRAPDLVVVYEGTCCELVWVGPDLTMTGMFWLLEVGEPNWVFWLDEGAVWNAGLSVEINEAGGTFPLFAAAAAKPEGKDPVEPPWAENWGDCGP